MVRTTTGLIIPFIPSIASHSGGFFCPFPYRTFYRLLVIENTKANHYVRTSKKYRDRA